MRKLTEDRKKLMKWKEEGGDVNLTVVYLKGTF